MYAINDYDALFESPFPIAEIYRQATGSNAGAVGLMVPLFLCIVFTLIGVYLTAGRTLWALSRDKATPFSGFLSKVHPRLGMPFNATITCACLVTVLGAIYVGSATAFNAFVGSFVVMITASYTAAILPHLLTGRKNLVPGPFWMKGLTGYVMNFVACGYMIVSLGSFHYRESRDVLLFCLLILRTDLDCLLLFPIRASHQCGNHELCVADVWRLYDLCCCLVVRGSS